MAPPTPLEVFDEMAKYVGPTLTRAFAAYHAMVTGQDNAAVEAVYHEWREESQRVALQLKELDDEKMRRNIAEGRHPYAGIPPWGEYYAADPASSTDEGESDTPSERQEGTK